MAAFDINNPSSVVSPGGVGFDINCGVRLIRTNLSVKDVEPVKEQLAQVRRKFHYNCYVNNVSNINRYWLTKLQVYLHEHDIKRM